MDEQTFPTGNPDIDREILLLLDLDSLDNICRSNKDIKKICNPWFWRLKFSRECVDVGDVDYEKLYRDVYDISSNTSLIYYAIVNNYIQLIKFLWENGLSLGDKQSILFVASTNEKYEIVKFILKDAELSEDKDYIDYTLDITFKYGYLSIIKLLLDHGATIDGGGWKITRRNHIWSCRYSKLSIRSWSHC